MNPESRITSGRVSKFLAATERYALVDSNQLAEARVWAVKHGADVLGLAAEMMRRNWLTVFQVNRILQDRAHELVLGPYLLLEVLGRGGMGEVFKARHRVMDRIVALKILRSDRLQQPDAQSRFQREIQAAAKLSHPNVVVAHDASSVGDVTFLVMEYVDGIDTARLLKERRRLPWPHASAIVRQAALGLHHAHERGLVHRDIKPSNLMIENPTSAAAPLVVKVLDVGLARLRSSEHDGALTHQGAVVGTPDYIAPEQAVDARRADGRADIYSLGCTLYHFLTGRPPFLTGTFTEKLLLHQNAEPAPVERLAPEVPPGLAGIVRKMMAKKPADRHQTAQEVADALAAFAGVASTHTPAEAFVPANTLSWSPDTSRISDHSWSRRLLRSPLAWAGLGLIALVVVAATAAVYLRTNNSHPLELAKNEGAKGLVNPPPGKQLPVANNQAPVKQPPALPLKKQIPLPAVVLGEPAKLAPPPAAAGARLVADLKGHTGNVACLAFSPDGQRLATGSHDQTVRVWNTQTGVTDGPLLRAGGTVRTVAWAPDGERIAAGSLSGGYEPEVRIWKLSDSIKPVLLNWQNRRESARELRSLAFSPDGTLLAVGGGPLSIWDLATGGLTMHSWQKTVPSHIYGVAFTPDGTAVAAGCHGGGGVNEAETVRIWKVGGPEEPIILQGLERAFGLSHSDIRATLSYSAGGKRLIRVTSDTTLPLLGRHASVMIWEVDLAKDHYGLLENFKIPGGGAVYALATAADGNVRVAIAVGDPRDTVGTFPGKAVAPPDQVTIWDSVTQQAQAFATGHRNHITALAFSADGRLLATGSSDQTAKLWNLTAE